MEPLGAVFGDNQGLFDDSLSGLGLPLPVSSVSSAYSLDMHNLSQSLTHDISMLPSDDTLSEPTTPLSTSAADSNGLHTSSSFSFDFHAMFQSLDQQPRAGQPGLINTSSAAPLHGPDPNDLTSPLWDDLVHDPLGSAFDSQSGFLASQADLEDMVRPRSFTEPYPPTLARSAAARASQTLLREAGPCALGMPSGDAPPARMRSGGPASVSSTGDNFETSPSQKGSGGKIRRRSSSMRRKRTGSTGSTNSLRSNSSASNLLAFAGPSSEFGSTSSIEGRPRSSTLPTEAELTAYSLSLSNTIRAEDFAEEDDDDSDLTPLRRGKRRASLKAARERAAAEHCGFALNDDGEVVNEEERRTVMNILERARREDLKICYHRLRDCIPELVAIKSVSKGAILQRGREIILELQEEDQHLSHQLEGMRQANTRLRLQVGLAPSTFSRPPSLTSTTAFEDLFNEVPS